jgi:hypothetical protein
MLWDSLADLNSGGGGGGGGYGHAHTPVTVANVTVTRSPTQCTQYDPHTLEVSFTGASSSSSSNSSSSSGGEYPQIVEPNAQSLCSVELPPGATILATATATSASASASASAGVRSGTSTNVTVAFETAPNAAGGSLVVVAFGNYGVTDTPVPVGKQCQDESATTSPQPLAGSVARIVSGVMADQALFNLGTPTNLSWVPKRVGAGEYILGVSNTRLDQQPLHIAATFGTVTSVEDVSTVAANHPDVSNPGYLPHGYASADIGLSTATSIAGADFRMLKVMVSVGGAAVGAEAEEEKEEAPIYSATVAADIPAAISTATAAAAAREKYRNEIKSESESENKNRSRSRNSIKLIPHAVAPKAPSNIWLRLPRATADVRDAILQRPSFRQLFSGVLLDWSYFDVRSEDALAACARWLHVHFMG